MTGAEQSIRGQVAGLILPRLQLQNRVVTGTIILIISVWYLFQLVVFFRNPSVEFVRWMFTTESFPAFSPGLLLATISHAFPPNLTHLYGNIAFLWVFGGESEQHMGRLETASFFFITALAAVLFGTALSGGNTMGASGGAFAFLGFYCVHMTVDHRVELELELLRNDGRISWRSYWGVVLTLLPFAVMLFLLGQSLGIIPVGKADVFGHSIGFLSGMGYGLVRHTLN